MLVGGGFWIAVTAVAVVLAPGWARTWVHEKIVRTLEARLETTVSVERVEIGIDHIDVFGVVVGDAAAPIVRLDVVHAALDPDAWWDRRARVVGVSVEGGRVQGSRADLEALARQARGKQEKGEASGGTRRVEIAVDSVHASDIWIVVDEDEGRLRHLEMRVTASVDLQAPAVEVELLDLRAHVAGAPPVTARRIRGRIVGERTDEGWAPVFPLRVNVEGVGAQVRPEIAVSGASGWVELADRDLSEVAVDLRGGFSDRSDVSESARLWQITGRVRRDLSAGSVWVDMAEFELGRVPEVLAHLPVVDSDAATIGGRLGVEIVGGTARVQGEVSLEGLNVEHPTLARIPVRDVGFDLAFSAEVEPAAGRVTLHRAVVDRDSVRVELDADVHHAPDPRHRRYRTHVRVPPVPCQNVLDAIPPDFVPSLQGFVLDGEFDLDLVFDADFSDLDRMVLGGDVGIWNCKAREVPTHASTERLAGGFTHRVTMRDGRQRSVAVYPHSGSFTSLSQISPHMVQAVLTTEDGGFWRHRGFLPSQFRTAMQRNFAAGKVRLGASTITMQMVKNVLLSHERTLSRKFQELFLTWWVETALSKDRIMELYLNVIEFGPGVYGVTKASRHYFGKYPEELSPPEAAYLALMLPSPVRRHLSYCRGALTASMQVKLARILSIMHDRKRLSDEDYELWREVPLEFDTSDRGSEGACLAEIETLLGAQSGQRALSGLLGDGDVSADEDPGPPPEGTGEDEGGERRGETRMRWTPNDDPADSDAPGRPAMDDADGETW